MRMISEVPEESFPLHKELLDRTGEPGLLGEVARNLAWGVLTYAALKPGIVAAIDRMSGAPAHACLPLLAGVSPLGKAWVEYTSVKGGRCGILGGTDHDGSVWVRLVRRDGAKPAWCIPASLRRMGDAQQVTTDWQALMEGRWGKDAVADKHWSRWAARTLLVELLDPALTPEQGAHLLGIVGIHDWVMLAAATSPMLMPDVASLVGAARH